MTRLSSLLCASASLWFILSAGCSGGTGYASGVTSAAPRYAAYDFVGARESVRPAARRRPFHEDTVLAASALGMASLADGDSREAREVLTTAYQIIESGNVNDEGRVFASTVLWEGAKVYKGEPFEQALTYTSLAVASGMEGDFESMRIAANATLRRLKDYAGARGDRDEPLSSAELAERAAQAEAARAREGSSPGDSYDYLRDEGAYVETDFALGYLLRAVAERGMGDDPSPSLAAAVKINPRLAPLCDAIASGSATAIVVVDWGRGPQKIAYGEDGALTRWVPRDRWEQPTGSLTVWLDGVRTRAFAEPVLSVNAMAGDHRWNNLEQVRAAKSTIGSLLTVGGAAVALGARDDEARLAGAGVAILGLLLKGSSRADTRHNELLPGTVFVAALELPEGTQGDLRVRLGNADVSLPAFRTGSASRPAVAYLRLFPEYAQPPFLASPSVRYSNDAAPPRPGDYPYILGGTCVATPNEAVLRAYQDGGYLTDVSLDGLIDLYRREGIIFFTGPDETGVDGQPNYRHVLEGGRALYTPSPGTVGYKRLMSSTHPPYRPRSPEVAALAERLRAQRAGATAPP